MKSLQKILLMSILSIEAGLLPSCNVKNSQELQQVYERGVKEGEERAIERMRPLRGKEAYEITPGNYILGINTNDYCKIPFKSLNLKEGRFYLVRKEKQNSFDHPIKAKMTREAGLDFYMFDPADYEVWQEDNNNFTKIDEINLREEDKKALVPGEFLSVLKDETHNNKQVLGPTINEQ